MAFFNPMLLAQLQDDGLGEGAKPKNPVVQNINMAELEVDECEQTLDEIDPNKVNRKKISPQIQNAIDVSENPCLNTKRYIDVMYNPQGLDVQTSLDEGKDILLSVAGMKWKKFEDKHNLSGRGPKTKLNRIRNNLNETLKNPNLNENVPQISYHQELESEDPDHTFRDLVPHDIDLLFDSHPDSDLAYIRYIDLKYNPLSKPASEVLDGGKNLLRMFNKTWSSFEEKHDLSGKSSFKKLQRLKTNIDKTLLQTNIAKTESMSSFEQQLGELDPTGVLQASIPDKVLNKLDDNPDETKSLVWYIDLKFNPLNKSVPTLFNEGVNLLKEFGVKWDDVKKEFNLQDETESAKVTFMREHVDDLIQKSLTKPDHTVRNIEIGGIILFIGAVIFGLLILGVIETKNVAEVASAVNPL